MMVRPKIDPSEHPIIVRLYRDERISSEALAKTYGVPPGTILDILRKHSVEIRSAAGFHTKNENTLRNNTIIALVADGMTTCEIAKHLGVTASTINEKLYKLGLFCGKKRIRFTPDDIPRLKEQARVLYGCGLTIRQASTRLKIHDRTVNQFLAEEPAIPLRTQGWKIARRAKALAQQRLGLYQSGMTLREIDHYLGDPIGSAKKPPLRVARCWGGIESLLCTRIFCIRVFPFVFALHCKF